MQYGELLMIWLRGHLKIVSSYLEDKSKWSIVIYGDAQAVDTGLILGRKQQAKLSVVVKYHV